MLDLERQTRTPWLYGRTEDSLVSGLCVSVTREASSGSVHVELSMRADEIAVLTGKVAVAADTWDALVADLPASVADSESATFAGAVRGRGIDFDATLALARRPKTNAVAIGLRPASSSRASCTIETMVDAETWARLVAGVSVA